MSLGSQGDNSGDHGSLVPQNGEACGKGGHEEVQSQRGRAAQARGRSSPHSRVPETSPRGPTTTPRPGSTTPPPTPQPQGWTEHGAWPQGRTEAVAEGVRGTDSEPRSLSATSRASVGWRTGPSPSPSLALLPNAGDTVTTHGQIRPRTGLWAGRQGSPQRADPRKGHASPNAAASEGTGRHDLALGPCACSERLGIPSPAHGQEHPDHALTRGSL